MAVPDLQDGAPGAPESSSVGGTSAASPASSAPQPSPSASSDEPRQTHLHANFARAAKIDLAKERLMGREEPSDASRCPHLEECMFPRLLSLDCQQIDDFCTGCVNTGPDTGGAGRVYIEALHLKKFLKPPAAILAENAVKGKRGRPDSPSKKKNRSSPLKKKAEDQVVDNRRLSQAYFGGVEGKRTWLLANSQNVGKGGGVARSYCQALPPSALGSGVTNEDNNESLSSPAKKAKNRASSSDELVDDLLASEVKIASLRKAMRLHDQSVPFDSLSDLDVLAKPLPEYSSAAVAKSPGSSPDKQSDDNGSPERPRGAPSSPETPRSFNSAATYPDCQDNRKASAFSGSLHCPKTNFDCALQEGKEAALAANKLLESFRQNRRNFWDQQRGRGKMPACAWCPQGRNCSSKANRAFGAIFDASTASTEEEEDSPGNHSDGLIQCLECNLIGCSPKFAGGEGGGNQHATLHFLMSGHRFGVTCGPLGEIFCMGCGDAVYHECFEQERERVFLEKNVPSLGWKETPILRSVDPSSFMITPENGVVWRGMMASYPTSVSANLVQAAWYAARRLTIFSGETGSGSIAFGAKAAELLAYRQSHAAEDRWIPKPVGMYNLGNTCYMSATLQCMIHCQPLQDLFLRKLAHPYQSCRSLRCGGKGDDKPCLACEMDRLFVEYYGSSVGVDALAALEEQAEFTSAASAGALVENDALYNRGHPIAPTNLLAECWRSSTMRNVAGHAQHDSQEFYNAFVDCLTSDALKYHKTAEELKAKRLHESQIKHSDVSSSQSGADLIQKMLTGTLRSILICKKCGCKRTQTESFSNVSLPLAKELSSNDPLSKSNTRRGKITVRSILDHFTRPESLADPVYCPSCNSKTKTTKQHTFATLPEVLCLHLKRFDAAANKKIADFVAFPPSLDMGKHLPHWRERGLERKDMSSGQPTADSPKAMYDMFATVNHKGTLHQGHYVANVKSGTCWYSCNDAFVTTAGSGDGEEEVLSSEGAYMLFYQRR